MEKLQDWEVQDPDAKSKFSDSQCHADSSEVRET